MRLLVTGGAGYIGSITARLLASRGHMVVIYDSLERGHAAAAGDLPLIEGLLGDTPHLTTTLRDYRIEAVVHFAAHAQVAESVENPQLYFSNNVGGTLSLACAMSDAGVEHIVFSSTAAVYGEPESQPIEESVPTFPTNPYGRSKHIAEQVLAGFAQSGRLRALALRYFNAAGAAPEWGLGEDHKPETHLIPLIIRAALSGKPLKVFGNDYPTPDGTCIRDYIHVLDLAEAHSRALEWLADSENTVGFDAINLGTGRGASVREVIEAAARVTGRTVPHEFAARRPGDPPRLVASNIKALEVLGWSPERSSMDEILGSIWEWSQKHPHGYTS